MILAGKKEFNNENIHETERLILKPTDKEDGEFIFKIMNTPKYYKYIGDRNIRTLEDAENYITQKMMPQYEKMGFGNFTVTLKSDSSKIGFLAYTFVQV